jgi:hypothetical protein
MIVLMQQRHPSEMPKVREVKRVEDDGSHKGAVRGAWQVWHRNGTRCPKGTVPIRRSAVHDVLRAKSLFHFGKKQRKVRLTSSTEAPDVVSGNGHEVYIYMYIYVYIYSLYIIFNTISIYINHHRLFLFSF